MVCLSILIFEDVYLILFSIFAVYLTFLICAFWPFYFFVIWIFGFYISLILKELAVLVNLSLAYFIM